MHFLFVHSITLVWFIKVLETVLSPRLYLLGFNTLYKLHLNLNGLNKTYWQDAKLASPLKKKSLKFLWWYYNMYFGKLNWKVYIRWFKYVCGWSWIFKSLNSFAVLRLKKICQHNKNVFVKLLKYLLAQKNPILERFSKVIRMSKLFPGHCL